MSLSNLLNVNNFDINCNSAHCGSINIDTVIELNNDPGSDGKIIANNNGLPEWRQIELPDIPVGPNNTFLYSNNNTISWNPLTCRVASYSMFGDAGGSEGVEPGAQNLSDINAIPDEFQVVLIPNPSIVTHPNILDFIIQKNGIYKVTFCACITNDNSSIQFYFILNDNLTTPFLGTMTTPVCNLDGFDKLPAIRNIAGVGVCMVRYFNFTIGDKFNVYSAKKYQQTLISGDQYFLGNTNCSLSFEYLGENYIL